MAETHAENKASQRADAITYGGREGIFTSNPYESTSLTGRGRECDTEVTENELPSAGVYFPIMDWCLSAGSVRERGQLTPVGARAKAQLISFFRGPTPNRAEKIGQDLR